MTIHSRTRQISRSGQYWAFAHFARSIRRGARRFESQGTVPDVDHIAVENPDGQRVLVVTNSGPARTVRLQMGGMVADVNFERDSMATLVWA